MECRKDHAIILENTCMPFLVEGINTIEMSDVLFPMHLMLVGISQSLIYKFLNVTSMLVLSASSLRLSLLVIWHFLLLSWEKRTLVRPGAIGANSQKLIGRKVATLIIMTCFGMSIKSISKYKQTTPTGTREYA